MADNTSKGKQAIDQQNIYIRDTLMSIASNYAEALKEAVGDAFDSAEAGTMNAVGKDLTRTFTRLAKMQDEYALNGVRINAGLLREKDVTKQLQSIAEKRAELARKVTHADLVGASIKEEDYKAALRSLDAQESMLNSDRARLVNIEKSLGLTGKLASALGKIPGIGQFLQVDEIEIEMRKAAASGAGNFRTMGIAASMVGKQLGAGLTDPAFIIGKIFDTYLKINKASVDLQHLTGQNAVVAASLGANYATAVDYLETAAALTKQTGMNAQNIFSSKVIGQAAALKATMGLTADEAGNLAVMSQTSGQNVNDLVDGVVATTSAFNGANRAAVSQGAVLREVANTSDSIKLSLGNNPESLAKAAAATRLGMSLKDVDTIAASLTEFQSSISNELEAELLTGKDLNLEKARELALSNDLVGLGKELFKNSSDIAEFGKMNRIQQEAQAKALGMTRDQLAKVAYQRAIDNGLTNEQAALAANVNAEDMKRVDAQKNFAIALEKIAGAVAPILDVIGSILSLPLAPYLILGTLAVAQLAGGFGTLAASLGLVAASEAEVAVAGAPAVGALGSAGVALGSFGASASAAIPVLLSVAAVAAGIGIAAAGLGLGFREAAIGFANIMDHLKPENISTLLLLGPALMGIAAGLAAIAIAGPMAIPALIAVAGLAAVSGGVAAAVGVGGSSTIGESKGRADEGSLTAVAAKLDTLIAVVKAGGDVYMDSNKVGRAHVLGSYKSA